MAHNKSLYQLREFKLAIGIPLLGAALSASWIAWVSFVDGNYEVCGSAECINNALGMLKLPLGISALIFPSVALVATQHRSVQTAAQLLRTDEQIRVTNNKNSFENFIKHRDMFDNKLADISNKTGLSFEDNSFLYELFFPSNSFSKFSPFSTIESLDERFDVMNFKKVYDEAFKLIIEINHRVREQEQFAQDDLDFIVDGLEKIKSNLKINYENGDFAEAQFQTIENINYFFATISKFCFEVNSEWLLKVHTQEISKAAKDFLEDYDF